MVYSAEKYSIQQKRLLTRENWALEDAKKSKLTLPSWLHHICTKCVVAKTSLSIAYKFFVFSFSCEPVTFLFI